jgi:hypothetical protein
MEQAEYPPFKKVSGVSGRTRDLAAGALGGKHERRKVMISGGRNDDR